MSEPPSYIRGYLTDHEHRHNIPRGEQPVCPRPAPPEHSGVRALITLSLEQARDAAQDQQLSDLIRGLLIHRPDLAIDGTHGRRP